jgi:tetratricopeptide (TPR) repeat protein
MRKFWLFLCVFWAIIPTKSQEVTFETAFTQVIVNMAHTQINNFDYEKARGIVDSGLGVFSNSAVLYAERGNINLLLYEWDVALDDFNRAIGIDSQYASAYFFRGNLFYTRAQRPEALADFERYLALAPNGRFATQAQQAITSIQIEINALGG